MKALWLVLKRQNTDIAGRLHLGSEFVSDDYYDRSTIFDTSARANDGHSSGRDQPMFGG
jgi:hypothetical protein